MQFRTYEMSNFAEKSRPFELPYFECVGRDPTMEEMKLCVCIQKRRPTIQKHWIGDKVCNSCFSCVIFLNQDFLLCISSESIIFH